MSMTACPDPMTLFEATRRPDAASPTAEFAAHIARCGTCAALVVLFRFRRPEDRSALRRVDCESTELDLASLLDGAADGSARSRALTHLAGCGACRDTYLALHALGPAAARARRPRPMRTAAPAVAFSGAAAAIVRAAWPDRHAAPGSDLRAGLRLREARPVLELDLHRRDVRADRKR